MRSIFLSPEQVFSFRLPILDSVGNAAPAADLALLTAEDDGFAIVLIQVPPLNAINAGDVSATLSNGDFAVFENAHLPVCVDLDDCWAFMLPVRKASHLVLTLRITGSMGWVSQLVSASAKVKMVYAGAN